MPGNTLGGDDGYDPYSADVLGKSAFDFSSQPIGI